MNQKVEPASAPTPAIPWWVATIVILGALLTGAGGLIALLRPEMLVAAGAPMTAAAQVYAGYLISRGLALAAMLLLLLALRAPRMLTGLMLFTALVQLIDALVDATTGRITLLPIVLIVCVAFLLGAARLAGPGFWKPATWRNSLALR